MATNWNEILSNTNNLNDVLSILKKVLAGLEVKADITTIDEAISNIDQLKEDINDKVDLLSENLDQKLGLDQLNEIGVGNRAYKAYAAMEADKTNIPAKSKVTVTNDTTESNNGDWQWDGIVFTKSTYDPLTQSKEFAETLVDTLSNNINEKISNKPTENILNILDTEGKLVAFIDSDGKLYLTGAEKPVQDYVSDINELQDDLKQSALESKTLVDTLANNINEKIDNRLAENLLNILDAEDKLIAFIDPEGELRLTNLAQSVQDILNSDNFTAKSNRFIHDKKSIITNDVQPYLLSCLSGGGIIAPMPFSQAPHQFEPPSGLLNVKITQGQRLVIDTPYRNDDGIVHPHILEFRNGFLGYRYILGLTPYFLTQDKYENPFIYGSNDLQNFEMIDKFPQPFSERPVAEFEGQYAYNSDDFFTYDFHSGELLFCWRRTFDNIDARNELWCRRTKNGLDWTAEELIYDSRVFGGTLLSPSIIFDFDLGLFQLFVIEYTASGWRIRRMTSPTLKKPKWEHSKYFQPIPSANIWHFEIRYVGNALYGIAHDDSMTGEDSTKDLYLCRYDKATDEFIWSTALITGEHYDPYKATFTPVFDHENNSVALQVLWSSRSGGDENMWKLYSSKSTDVNL